MARALTEPIPHSIVGGVLREGYDYDFSRLDPATGSHVDPAWCAVYETLAVNDRQGRPGPMLASGWRVSDDLLRWRFRIRAGASFQSGDSCGPDEVAAALRLHADPEESPVNQFFWTPVQDIQVENEEVVVVLKHPYARLPTLVRSWHSAIHNPRLRKQLGSRWGWEDADGTGPFSFVRTEPGREQEVRRWRDYANNNVAWLENRGPARVEGIVWLPILDERSRAHALEHGDVDCVQNPSFLDVGRLRANPELRVIAHQQSALAYLALDHQTPAYGFDDLRVRRAISHAIDRRRLIYEALAGEGDPAFGPVPSRSEWYAPEVERSNQYDPDLSRRLLDEAGWRPRSDGIRLSFEALVLQDATLRRAAKLMQTMLRSVGVQLHLKEIDGFADFYAAVGEHPPAFISKWLWPDPVDAVIGFVASWSQSGPNWQRASIASVDEACTDWLHAGDTPTLRDAATRLQVAAASNLPLIPLYFPNAIWAHHRRVHGWDPIPSNLYPLYNDVWLEPAKP